MVRRHRGVHNGHHFAGLSADHGEAENAVVILSDQRLHETVGLAGRLRPEHGFHRQLGDARFHALTFRFAFA
jgi:hypothetical protein